MEIQGANVVSIWKKALRYVVNNGHTFRDNENRICREVLNLVLKVDKPVQDTTKPMEMLAGLKKWVYPSQEELVSSILGKRDIPGYYFTYGGRIFNFSSAQEAINQIDRFVIPLLKRDPMSRRAVIVLYNPLKDSLLYRKETPGMLLIDFKIRNRLLNATVIIRSNDLFIGWPANIFQTYLLQKYISERMNCEIGPITTLSISAHVFDEQLEDIHKVLEKR